MARVELSRAVAGAARAGLRREHSAQVSLLSIIGGAIFEYGIHGVLVPTKCPNIVYGRRCNREDFYGHLPRCNSLQSKQKKGVKAAVFLILMARRTPTDRPGAPVPMFGQ